MAFTDDAVISIESGPFDIRAELIERAVRRTLEERGGGGDISITVLPDSEMARLNLKYLGKEGPTDVIAFSLGEEFWPLGDIYLGGDQAGRQAAEHGVRLDEEMTRLAIHGTLHVIGFDHPDGEARCSSAMFDLQETLVEQVMATDRRTDARSERDDPAGGRR